MAQVSAELARIEPERQSLRAKGAAAQTALETARNRVKQLETERMELELEVETKKQEIERYSVQQFQTRKNEEYRALAHEIEACQQGIVKIEDHELEVMEQIETLHRQIATAGQALAETNKEAESEGAVLAAREENLNKELAALESRRSGLAAGVEESALARYERLFYSKGGNVIVGIQHGVCGGCHMRVPPQLLVHCQAQQELVICPNCARVLYYTQDMDLAVAE
jgi:hypothetical protein